jgi:hypothetical protein
VSTALVPVIVHRFGWMAALGGGSALAIVAAVLWLFIHVDQSDAAPPAAR